MNHEEVNKNSRKAIEGLEPKVFWDFFYQLSRIPRESKHEQKVGEWLMKVGKEMGLETKMDAIKNVLIKVPATKGYENVPTITLQGHQDMVCEKAVEKVHDFAKDPIELVLKEGGKWLGANKTTLGADNGLGVVASLALCKERDTFKHGPFECLFTVDEETGMTGVFKMEKGFFEGKNLLNLDSEDWGEIFVGCAGGADITLFGKIGEEKNAYPNTYEVELDGLKGGHSGCDIHIERANALKVFARLLHKMNVAGLKYGLSWINVPSKYNAIPRYGKLNIACDEKTSEEMKKLIDVLVEECIKEYETVDGKPIVVVKKIDNAEKIWNKETLLQFIRVVYAIPHGVERMSHDLEDPTVETSNNLANCYVEDGKVKLGCCTRSFIVQSIKNLQQSIASIAELAGYEYKIESPYPGWKPNMNAKILKTTVASYKKKFPTEGEPKVKAIHAGLECGLLIEKGPEGLECVSIGPTVKNAHTPNEMTLIEDAPKFHAYLLDIFESWAEENK